MFVEDELCRGMTVRARVAAPRPSPSLDLPTQLELQGGAAEHVSPYSSHLIHTCKPWSSGMRVKGGRTVKV